MTKKKTDAATVLFPEISIEHDDKSITVKEFTFGQGLRIGQLVDPIVTDLGKLFLGDDKAEVPLEMVAKIFSNHDEQFLQLLSMTTGLDEAEISELPNKIGHQLLMAFWAVNAGFFVNRVVESIVQIPDVEQASAAS